MELHLKKRKDVVLVGKYFYILTGFLMKAIRDRTIHWKIRYLRRLCGLSFNHQFFQPKATIQIICGKT